MTETLLLVALILLAAIVFLLLVLAVRRVALRAEDRRRAEAERLVRPLAIALVEEDDATTPTLSAGDQAVLADVLGRYARKLSGQSHARIGAYFRTSAALPGALRQLRSRRAWRRAEAAYRLGDMCCPEVAPHLLVSLDDRRRDVRAAAARSLGRLGVVDAALPLIQQLVSARLPRGVAGEALVELGPPVVPELRHIATHPEPAVRATAMTVLGFVGDPRDSEVALGALRDASAEVREAAAEALGRIGASDAEAELGASLDDRVLTVRAATATALGELDARSAVPRLLQVARTDEFRPARAAARAVARIDGRALQEAAARPGAGPHLHEAADLQAL
jgi:HEAT repeat protein